MIKLSFQQLFLISLNLLESIVIWDKMFGFAIKIIEIECINFV